MPAQLLPHKGQQGGEQFSGLLPCYLYQPMHFFSMSAQPDLVFSMNNGRGPLLNRQGASQVLIIPFQQPALPPWVKMLESAWSSGHVAVHLLLLNLGGETRGWLKLGPFNPSSRVSIFLLLPLITIKLWALAPCKVLDLWGLTKLLMI